MLRSSLLAASAVALLLPAAAQAAPLRESFYDVTVEVEMAERWKYDMHKDSSCMDSRRCVEDAKGSGEAKLHLRTPTPQRVAVMTGGRMQPSITYAVDSGIPLKGAYKRTGTYTDTYSGAWDAANEDVVGPTGGCGTRNVRTELSLGWQGRNRLAPVMLFDDRRECPTGPPRGFDYATAPSLGDIAAQVAETKFGRTRQFRVRGTRTWAGTFPAINRQDPDDVYVEFGQSEIRWSWEATFRKVTKKPRRRR